MKVRRYPRCLIVSPPIGPPQHRSGHSDDDAEQAAIRRRAMAAIGSVAGGDPTRSERASELVGEIIYRKHVKESNALAPLRPSDSLTPAPFLQSSIAATNSTLLRQGLRQEPTAASYDRSCARRSFLPR